MAHMMGHQKHIGRCRDHAECMSPGKCCCFSTPTTAIPIRVNWHPCAERRWRSFRDLPWLALRQLLLETPHGGNSVISDPNARQKHKGLSHRTRKLGSGGTKEHMFPHVSHIFDALLSSPSQSGWESQSSKHLSQWSSPHLPVQPE